MNKFWTTGLWYELAPVDGPGNGVITVQTFNDRLQEVIAKDGLYTIWPIYETEVNANQWNSFCIGSNLQSRTIFLARNGKVLHNFTQPELWADLNIGLDTSALEPLQVIRETKGTSTSRHIAKWVKIGSTPKQPLSRPGRLLNLSPARRTGPGVRMAATYRILLS